MDFINIKSIDILLKFAGKKYKDLYLRTKEDIEELTTDIPPLNLDPYNYIVVFFAGSYHDPHFTCVLTADPNSIKYSSDYIENTIDMSGKSSEEKLRMIHDAYEKFSKENIKLWDLSRENRESNKKSSLIDFLLKFAWDVQGLTEEEFLKKLNEEGKRTWTVKDLEAIKEFGKTNPGASEYQKEFGYTLKQIAEKAHLNPNSVQKALSRTKGKEIKEKPSFKKEEELLAFLEKKDKKNWTAGDLLALKEFGKLREDVQREYTNTELAKKLNVSIDTIQSLLQEKSYSHYEERPIFKWWELFNDEQIKKIFNLIYKYNDDTQDHLINWLNGRDKEFFEKDPEDPLGYTMKILSDEARQFTEKREYTNLLTGQEPSEYMSPEEEALYNIEQEEEDLGSIPKEKIKIKRRQSFTGITSLDQLIKLAFTA